MMTPRSSIFFSILFCILLVFLNIHTSQTISTDKPKSITLKLHHVSSLYPDLSPEALFKLNRVKHQRLGSNSDNGSKIDEGFETPITPGTNTSPFLSEYFAVLRIGLSPSNRYILLMDTSTPLTWIQCLPCSQCFKQVAPMYDPLLSPTYSAKNCSEYKSVCTGCNESGECTYVKTNDDRSVLMGVIAGEVFRFDQSVFLMNFTFGCMDYSSLTYKGMDGVLGLGRGELSFPSQLNSKFSYCLGDKSKSSLRFGQDVLDHPNQIVYTPMIHPKFDQSNYFINLTNITVADYNFPTTHMVLPDGIMIDPGSRDTYLPMIVFQAVREPFNIAALQLGWKLVESESPNNLCYNMSEFTTGGISTIEAPGVTLHFAGDAFLELKFQNLFYNLQWVDANLYCLAVRATKSDGIPVLGSTLQQGIRVVYDNGASVIGFDPNSC